MAESLRCWNCGESLDDVPLPISRHASCASCFEVLHCCRMCRHYSPKQTPYCDDDRTDPPTVKETANFCEYFQPDNCFNAKDTGRSGKAKSALDNLFDGADTQSVSDSALSNSELPNSALSNSELPDTEDGDVDADDPLNKFNGMNAPESAISLQWSRFARTRVGFAQPLLWNFPAVAPSRD